MQVIVFMKATAKSEAGEMPTEQEMAAGMAYNERLVAAGVLESCEGMHPTSRGARVVLRGSEREAELGPFGGDPNQHVAGFWILNVESLDEAIEWAKQFPNPMDGVLEIRPIIGPEDCGDALTPELQEQLDRIHDLAAAR